MPRSAPILQDVAARIAGREPAELRDDPVGWAYVLRDAVALASPQVIVSHLDPELEVAALPAGDGDPVDALLDVEEISARPPLAAAVELVRTLAAMPGYGDRVAATITAPADVAARLAAASGEDADLEELADVAGDLLAGLVEAYGAAGAGTVVIAEWGAAPGAAAAEPLLRAAAHARIEAVLWSVSEPLAGDLALTRVPAETSRAELAALTTT